MKKFSIGIIGAGVMGQAMAQNLSRRRVCSRTNIFVAKRNMGRAVAAKADIIILAVKPQDFSALALELGSWRPHQLVISIMAGVPLDRLKSELHHKKIIRAMPNLAAQIGQAFVVWKTGTRLRATERRQVATIFSSLGVSLEVKREAMINRATAVSGSGPAYLYYFIEALTIAAIRLGFSQIVAKQMVDQTLAGALAVYSQSGETASIWRERVTSKKGTTAAALKVLEKGQFAPLIKQAINAAYKRAKQL